MAPWRSRIHLRGIENQKWVCVLFERSFGPRIDLLAEVTGKPRDGLPAELSSAQLGGDLFDAPRGDALVCLLHQG